MVKPVWLLWDCETTGTGEYTGGEGDGGERVGGGVRS